MIFLLFDLDGTILDFKKGEENSLRKSLRKFNISADDGICTLYSAVNDSLWKEYEKGTISQDEIKARRFEIFLRKIGRSDVDYAKLAKLYQENLSNEAIMIPGAIETLGRVKGKKGISSFIITNGTPSVQRSRIEKADIGKYFDDVFISREIGFQKPDVRFFDYVLEKIKGVREKSIVIGDSETSDIKGAVNAGMRSIYIGKERSRLATWSVERIAESIPIIDDIVEDDLENK